MHSVAYQCALRVLLTTLGAHETVSQSIYTLSVCTKVWLTKDVHNGTFQNVLQKSVEALVACNIFYNICSKRWLLTTDILILLTVISNLRRKDMRESKDTGYFHICTDGASISWMFQDDHDFIAGVNRIGICLLKTGGKVIAYVLMDNHVHFVLYGTMPQCKAFITLYKRLTGKWILTKYGISDYLRHLPTDILRIDTEERLLNTIAYIDRNP